MGGVFWEFVCADWCAVCSELVLSLGPEYGSWVFDLEIGLVWYVGEML